MNPIHRFINRLLAPRPEKNYTVRTVIDPIGNEFKVFGDGNSPAILPQNRFIPAELAMLQAMNILDYEELVKRTDEMIALFDKGKIGAISAVLHEQKARLQMCAPLKCYLELACVYVMLPNEPAERYLPAFQQQKLKYWEENPESGFFFANLVRAFIPTISTTSSGDYRTLLLMSEIAKKTTDAYVTARMSETN